MQAINFLPTIEPISPDNPFNGDVLEREGLARSLTSFLDTFVDRPFTLGLNGVWGSGKTYFLERWQAKLQKEGYQTLHFNAWENDFADDPFAALLSEFRKLVATTPEEVRQWKKVTDASMPILRRVAAGALKNLTLGLIELESKDIEQLLAGAVEDAAKYAVDRCEQARDSINNFRDELSEFVEKHASTRQNKPIYFFIDELDRCRPTFAISVLERVKHLLQVKGVVFVFAWDRSQLNSTIRAVYGDETSVGGYLMRFVDLEYDLPKRTSQSLIQHLATKYNMRQFLLKLDRSDELSELEKLLNLYTSALGLSIREIHKCLTLLAIYIRSLPSKRVAFMELACFLVVLRVKHPQIYREIRDVSQGFEAILSTQLQEMLGADVWKSVESGTLEGYLIFHFDKAKGKITRLSKLTDVKAHSWSLRDEDYRGDRERELNEVYKYLINTKEQLSPVSMVVNGLDFAGGFSGQV